MVIIVLPVVLLILEKVKKFSQFLVLKVIMLDLTVEEYSSSVGLIDPQFLFFL